MCDTSKAVKLVSENVINNSIRGLNSHWLVNGNFNACFLFIDALRPIARELTGVKHQWSDNMNLIQPQ